MKHLGMSREDVLLCPTYERRYYLNMLINENKKSNEMMEQKMQEIKGKNSSGSRTTRIGGEQLKSKLKSGEIPN